MAHIVSDNHPRQSSKILAKLSLDVTGEYVRKNIVEYQAGVPITLDYQVINVDTCEPVSDVYVEIWHCNATGVYSGVDSPQGGLNSTWLRGIQLTDEDGVAQFESVFPGHYTGRATHIHVLVHHNATIYRNGTLGHDATATHIGQSFFDQNAAVELLLMAWLPSRTGRLPGTGRHQCARQRHPSRRRAA